MYDLGTRFFWEFGFVIFHVLAYPKGGQLFF